MHLYSGLPWSKYYERYYHLLHRYAAVLEGAFIVPYEVVVIVGIDEEVTVACENISGCKV